MFDFVALLELLTRLFDLLAPFWALFGGGG